MFLWQFVHYIEAETWRFKLLHDARRTGIFGAFDRVGSKDARSSVAPNIFFCTVSEPAATAPLPGQTNRIDCLATTATSFRISWIQPVANAWHFSIRPDWPCDCEAHESEGEEERSWMIRWYKISFDISDANEGFRKFQHYIIHITFRYSDCLICRHLNPWELFDVRPLRKS